MSVAPFVEQCLQAADIKQINSTKLYPALHAAGDAGLPMLVIDNHLGRAVIALQGVQVMAFPARRPVGDALGLTQIACLKQANRSAPGLLPAWPLVRSK